MRKYDSPIWCLLGRAGDTILMLPAFLEIYSRTGLKPRVIVSTDYSNIYDGISYVQPIPERLHWYNDVSKARAMAEALSEDAVFPQFWVERCPIPPEYRGTFNLTCFGHNWGVNLALWPNFMASMWERCGFTQEEMVTLPLVFDRRDSVREAALVARLYPVALRKKPLLLYNFTGISSPYGHLPELWPTIQRFNRDFHMVDLGKIQAHRIYDLLGLYDAAAGLITIDTATAHLAPASNVSTLWFTVDGWTSSVPRGNVALHVKYNETPRRLHEIGATLERWKRNGNCASVFMLDTAGRGGNPKTQAGAIVVA